MRDTLRILNLRFTGCQNNLARKIGYQQGLGLDPKWDRARLNRSPQVVSCPEYVAMKGWAEMPPIESLPYFLLAMLVISMTPGPDMLGILSYGIARGRQAGMGFAFGVGLGTLFHTVLAVVGISAVVATSPWAFRFILYAGASYLIYLGTKALMSRGNVDEFAIDDKPARQSFGEACLRGFVCNALNPKVGLFFLAFLPQFIDAGRPAWSQLLVLGIVFWLWTTLSYSLLGYYCGVVGQWIRGHASTGRWIDRVTGTLFVGLGLHLIFTGQKS